MAENGLSPAFGVDGIFTRPRWLSGLLLVLLLAGGAAFRLYDLTDPPLDFHPTRQVRSLIIARGMYMQNQPDVPEWQREFAIRQWRAQDVIEPPIMEALAAFTYHLLGGEVIWIGRLYSIFFWLLGGLGLWLLGRRLMGMDAALIALMLYLGLPYAILASRSFQPDPLMTAAIIWALWAAVEWHSRQSWRMAVLAGLLAGLALLVKWTAVFFVAGGWLGLLLAGNNLRRLWGSRQVWVIAGLAVLPSLLYALYSALVLNSLQGQLSLRFFPQMWLEAAFYLRWWTRLNAVLSLPWLVLMLIGFFVVESRPARWLMLGWAGGYSVYGFLFSYYVGTHDYYHLPLIPLAGLGAGGALAFLLHHLRLGLGWRRGATVFILALIFLSEGWSARTLLKRQDFRPVVAQIQTIAAQFLQDDTLVSLAPDYSLPLVYWGWLNTTHWFGVGDFALRQAAGQTFDFEEYFDQQTSGRDYFLVTDFEELARQPLLQSRLEADYPLIQQGYGFRVYDLRQRKESP